MGRGGSLGTVVMASKCAPNEIVTWTATIAADSAASPSLSVSHSPPSLSLPHCLSPFLMPFPSTLLTAPHAADKIEDQAENLK